MEAIKQNGNSLRHVPDNLKTKCLCLKAVENSVAATAMHYVPDNLKTEQLYSVAESKKWWLSHVRQIQ